MEIFGINYFSIDFVVGPTASQAGVGTGCAGIGIAGLNHEIFNHTVEQGAVVVVVAHEAHEVVAVFGGVAVEQESDVAHGGFHAHFHRSGVWLVVGHSF